MLNHRIVVFSLLAIAAGTSACNFIYDFDRMQCESTSDCTDRGEAFASTRCVEGFCESSCESDDECEQDFQCVDSKCVDRWECLGEPDEDSSTMLTLGTVLTDIEGNALSDVEVLVCSNFDPQCEAPSDRVMTDASGRFEFEVASSFGGYLDIEVDGFFPQLNFLPRPLKEGIVLRTVTLSPTTTIQALAAVVGAAPDPDRGHVLLSLESCTDNAKGVQLTAPRSDDESILFFVNGGFPTADLSATTEDGSGGYLNFRPGNATLTLTSQGGQDLTQLSFTVRKGTLSVLHFQPHSLYFEASN